MKINKKITFITITGVFVAAAVYVQKYIEEKNRREIKGIARELAYTWKSKIDLTEAQTLLLEDLIIDYTIRKNEVINAQIKENSMIRRLQAVQRLEHRALQKILTPTQFEDYIAISNQVTSKA